MKPPEDAPFYGNPDACDTHRYWLHREFGSGKGNILFIMLNPSHALSLGTTSDHTVDKCIRFARSWGYRDLTVVNLFAFRSSKPCRLLYRPNEIVGTFNDMATEWAIQKTVAAEGKVVCAWGADYCSLWCRNCYVLGTLTKFDVQGYCLGMTKKGHPKHPGRMKKTAPVLEKLPPWVYASHSTG